MTFLIAHRGASHDAPENTLAAFRLAWQQSADGIEGDFCLTADGRIVCFHDEDTQRITAQPGLVQDASYADLQKLDAGAWMGPRWRGEKIPSLEQVLAVVPRGKKALLELKAGPAIVSPLADVLEQANVTNDDVLLISLVEDTVAECKRRLPQWNCHWLSGYQQNDDGNWTPHADDVIATIRRLGADGFGSQAIPEHFDEAFVHRLQAAGINEFHVWTVDDPSVARFYRRLGAWGITTNRPAFLRAQLDNA
jgi:glycerophosphoryl diester phosphodiesterase